MGKYTAAAFLSIWVAIAALSWMVGQEFGWGRLKRHAVTLAVLAFSLLSLPGAAVVKLGWPYKDRILARFIPHHSPTVNLSLGCSVFPANNIWNTPVSGLPIDANSSAYVQSMGPDSPLHPDFSATGSVPYMTVDGSNEIADVTFGEGGPESDPGPYRIPDNAPIEVIGDRHVIILDTGRCRLYELFNANRLGHLHWEADSGAIYDLRSNQLRPEGWTSADAAGLPIFAGLVRYDEVKTGQIRHAIRFTTPHTRRKFVWPARHFASSSTDPNLPPMGQRFRLRASFEVNGMTTEARVILTALKEYGMILADNGGPWYITGSPDSNWNSATIADLKKVHGSDFEAVDSSTVMLDQASGEARK